METLEEIIGQYDRAEYDADCRRIAADQVRSPGQVHKDWHRIR